MRTNVIILRGPIAVGKSTTADLLKTKLGANWIHVDIDKFKHLISLKPSPTRTAIAHKTARFFVEQLLSNKYKLIITELFREGDYREMLGLLKKRKCVVYKVFLHAGSHTLVVRDRARNYKTLGQKTVKKYHSEIVSLNEDLKIDTTKQSASRVVREILQAII